MLDYLDAYGFYLPSNHSGDNQASDLDGGIHIDLDNIFVLNERDFMEVSRDIMRLPNVVN